MNVYSVLSFSMSKHQQKVFMNFFNRSFGHQVVWCTLYEQVKFTVVSLSNTYVISRIGFQVLFLFRYYFVKYLLLKFSSICFNSPVSISHFFLFLSSQWRFFLAVFHNTVLILFFSCIVVILWKSGLLISLSCPRYYVILEISVVSQRTQVYSQ